MVWSIKGTTLQSKRTHVSVAFERCRTLPAGRSTCCLMKKLVEVSQEQGSFKQTKTTRDRLLCVFLSLTWIRIFSMIAYGRWSAIWGARVRIGTPPYTLRTRPTLCQLWKGCLRRFITLPTCPTCCVVTHYSKNCVHVLRRMAVEFAMTVHCKIRLS